LIDTLKEFALTEVSQIYHSPGNVFNPRDPISKALGYMKETGRREIVASKGEKVGILDVRTILDVEQPHSKHIERQWAQLRSFSPNDKIIDAVRVLHGRNIWAIPILEKKDVVGILSHEDIVNALCVVEELNKIKVQEVAQLPVTTIQANASIALARRMMLDNDFSQIPVIENNKLIGMITAEELVHTFITSMSKTTRGDRVGEKGARFQGQVKGIMDPYPHVVKAESNLIEVSKGIRDLNKTASVVIDEKLNVQGIITQSDLLQLILRAEEPEEIPVFIVGISDEDFFEKAIVEEKIRRTIKKNLKIHPDITEVRVRVKSIRSQGERTHYELSTRAISPRNQFNASHQGWGLMESFDGLCDALDKSLKRAKKEPQKGTRRGRRRPNPHLKS
jgi:predicted transcriptional regulator/ribosome-associated translation inhibitor RaiA